MNNITFRQATAADAEELARLRWAFRTELHLESEPAHPWEEFRAAMLKFLAGAFASGDWTIWLAESGGRTVAHIYIRRIWKVPNPVQFDPCIGYVTNVYTIPEWRCQGVGGELMRVVQQWAAEAGFELLFLWPSRLSVPFYLREGFSQDNKILEYIISKG